MPPSDFTRANTEPSPESNTPLAPGVRIADRFEVQRLAGSGGMGEVYLAWDSVLERSVALKAVRPREGESAEYLERFRREALALAQLNHPHVCQVYDFVFAAEGTFIAMEWLEGKTLDLAAAELSPKDKLRVLWEIAQGLAAAHEKGLVHRDLKPGNLMIAQGGTLKILDFGLARLKRNEAPGPDPQPTLVRPDSLPPDEAMTALQRVSFRPTPQDTRSTDSLTQVGYFMGSPRYASPEQIRAESAEAPSDVFSLGLLAWELLLGEHPFPGEGRARFKAVVENRRRPLKARALPRAVAQVLDGMLQSRPQARPSAAEVARIFQKAQRPLNPIWWVTLGALVALGTGGLAFLALTRSVVADLTREHPARVAILPVRNQTGNTSLDSELRWVVPELLALGLQEQPRLVTVPSSSLQPVLARLGPMPGPPSPDFLKRLGSPVGANLFLTSTLELHAGQWQLRYQLVDLQGKVRTTGNQSSPAGAGIDFQTMARAAATELGRAIQPLHRSEGASPISVPAEALRKFGEGRELMNKGNFQEALAPLAQAAEQAPHFAPAATQWGLCLRKAGQPGALAAIQWGRWAARAAGLRRTEIQALTEMGMLHLDTGAWDAAQQNLAEAMRLAQAAGDEDFQSAILNNQAFLAMERKQYAASEPLLHRALVIQRRLGKRADEILTLNNLAILAKERGDISSAQVHYRTVLETALSLGDRWTESIALNNLGDVALSRLDFPEAEQKFKAALQVKASIGNRAGLIIPTANLGILARTQGNWEEGRNRLDEALRLCRELNRTPLEAVVRFQQGCLELAANKPREAQAHFQAALEFGQQLRDSAGQCQALAGLAEVALAQRDLLRADSLLRQAREKGVDGPHYWRAEGLHRLAKGDREGARASLERSRQLALATAPEELPGVDALLARLR